MFTKILIANRGEIACRVATTARRMGVQTVAVHSTADAKSRHVMACDEAILIGGPEPKDSYLKADVIIEAALRAGAQAIHPGYGFLSENAGFAEGCAQAGLVFIGPPAQAIRLMGSKSGAKALMAQAGVPLVPGYHGEDQSLAVLASEAQRMGYPVMIKASAGGGGKGMRIVRTSEAFEAALVSCQREALSSFGDDRVLIERYVERPRHVEIQVFADQHGQAVSLFERDCSVQRRHQKVIEEAPAPMLPAETRKAMGEAAVAAAKAVNYEGAGTVEFILDPSGAFYFMEMNTRLQVEHPVTEMVTGLDLVEWQLRVASGEPLPLAQHELTISGHSIEARVYAEAPERGFLPSIGTLGLLKTPTDAVAFTRDTAAGGRASVRVDSGVREGDAITPFYDPMIAKLIVWAPSRGQAVTEMSRALSAFRVGGPASNLAFLARLMQLPDFQEAALHTGLIEQNADALLLADMASVAEHAVVAALLVRRASVAQTPVGAWPDPFAALNDFRLGAPLTRVYDFERPDVSEGTLSVRLTPLQADLFRVQVFADDDSLLEAEACLLESTGSVVRYAIDGHQKQLEVLREGEYFQLCAASGVTVLRDLEWLAHAGEGADEGGRLTAPMPGKIVAVMVADGDAVSKGQALLVMEAMKMEHTIVAGSDGVVEAVLHGVGDQVPEGAQLVRFSVQGA